MEIGVGINWTQAEEMFQDNRYALKLDYGNGYRTLSLL